MRENLVFAVIGDVYDKPLGGCCAALRNHGVEAVVTIGSLGNGHDGVRLVPFDGGDGKAFSAAVTAAYDETPDAVAFAELKGYRFVLCDEKELSEDLAEKYLEPRRAELKGSRPFFYFQRRHPNGTCAGDFVPGQDVGVSTQFLSGFPNAVAFSESGHAPLLDDRMVKQGDFGFTAVQLSSFRAPLPLGGRENSSLDPTVKRWRPAVIVRVSDDRIVFERLALLTGEKLGDDWTMPLGTYGALTYANQAARAKTPQFGPGAKVSVSFGRGRTLKGAETDQVTVSWNRAEGVRAFDYEVRAAFEENGADQVILEKRVYSAGLFGPPSAEPDRVSCVFAKDELYQDARIRFEVRPLNCFGAKGEAIVGFATVPSGRKTAKG